MTEATETAMADCRSVYIGLGANLENPRRQVERAVDELQALSETCLAAVSPCYRTAPIGPASGPAASRTPLQNR